MVRHTKKLSVLAVLIIYVLGNSAALSSPDTYETETPDDPANRRQNLVIQLAIIGDQDLGKLFENNNNKLLDYWKAVLYDVHMRFQTLHSFNFSFQITSFGILDKPEALIENQKNKQGEIDINGVLSNMPKWLGPYVGRMRPFDIALLVTAAKPIWSNKSFFGASSESSICLGNIIPGEWISNVVVSVRTPDVALTTAQVIAQVLGAVFDDKESFQEHDCGSYADILPFTYLMDSSGGLLRHIFSNCTNKILAHSFNIVPPTCLLPDGEENLMYDSAKYIPGFLSTDDQCRLRTNSLEVTANELHVDRPCEWVKCQPMASSNEKAEYILPLDGSPCGTQKEGVCFRHMCSLLQVRFVSVKTGNCMDGNADLRRPKTLTRCVFGNIPQTELIRIMLDAEYGNTLVQMWAGVDKSGRCLQVDSDGYVKLEPCELSPNLGWEVTPLESHLSSRFMIRHLGTNSCMKAVLNSSRLVGSGNCNKSDASMHWNLVLGNGTVLTHDNYERFVQRTTAAANSAVSDFLFMVAQGLTLFVSVLLFIILLEDTFSSINLYGLLCFCVGQRHNMKYYLLTSVIAIFLCYFTYCRLVSV